MENLLDTIVDRVEIMSQHRTEMFSEKAQLGPNELVLRRGFDVMLQTPGSSFVCTLVHQEGYYDVALSLRPKKDGAVFQFPADSIPGTYVNCRVESNSGSLELPFVIYLICNPFCSSDEAFFSGPKADLAEYLFAKKGQIFRGSVNHIYSQTWRYDSFSSECLQVLMLLLKSRISIDRLKDTRYLIREICALANSNDDSGVLTGNWTDTEGGVNPLQWLGSSKIFRIYLDTMEPVRYGQCWVFAGILCSLYRCLGIATRVVTNFNSASTKLPLRGLLERHGRPSTVRNVDTRNTLHRVEFETGWDDNFEVWNFHVWNEVFFGLDWSVCDATPQGLSSDGRYCLGPVPKSYVRGRALVDDEELSYLQASISDLIYLHNLVQLTTHQAPSGIGRYIVTTSPEGSYYDITQTYKNSNIDSRHQPLKVVIKRPNGEEVQAPILGEDLSIYIALTEGFFDPQVATLLFSSCDILYQLRPRFYNKQVPSTTITLRTANVNLVDSHPDSVQVLSRYYQDLLELGSASNGEVSLGLEIEVTSSHDGSCFRYTDPVDFVTPEVDSIQALEPCVTNVPIAIQIHYTNRFSFTLTKLQLQLADELLQGYPNPEVLEMTLCGELLTNMTVSRQTTVLFTEPGLHTVDYVISSQNISVIARGEFDVNVTD